MFVVQGKKNPFSFWTITERTLEMSSKGKLIFSKIEIKSIDGTT